MSFFENKKTVSVLGAKLVHFLKLLIVQNKYKLYETK